MSKASLLNAARNFTFFPSIAELTDFFTNGKSEEHGQQFNAVIDTRSGWYVDTKNRWFNSNDWDKNISKRHEVNFGEIGGIFETIIADCGKRKND